MRKCKHPRNLARRNSVSSAFSLSPSAQVEIHAHGNLVPGLRGVPNTRVLAYSDTAKNLILLEEKAARHCPLAARVANPHPSSTQHGEI